MNGFPVRRAVRLALAAGVAFVAPSPQAAAKPKLPSRTVVCGEVLTESLRVANNLSDCPGDGVVVGAPGITLDLGDHRIDGVAAAGSAGIDNSAGHDDVVIRGGIVIEFETGVRLENASGNTLTLLHVSRNYDGIELVASSNNTLKANVATGNDNFGVGLSAASNTNSFSANEVSSNGSSGISTDASSENLFVGNRVSGNGGLGIEIAGGSGHTLKGNTAQGNRLNGIGVEANDSLVKANRVSANDLHGIEISGGSNNVVVTGNTAHENGVHGILAVTNAVTLTKNKANANGFIGGGAGDDVGLGLLVPAGATSSGNKAVGNDDPNECEASDLSCARP